MAARWLTSMKQYESAFLGLILAGVLMMIIGLGLMLSSVHSADGPRWVFAERQAIDLPAALLGGTKAQPGR